MSAFDYACEQAGIEHRLTKPGHPWTHGQVERMNRTLKDATVKRYDDETYQQLKEHLYNFLNADNFAKRLKTLQGLMPDEYIVKCWQQEPERFRSQSVPSHLGTKHLTSFSLDLREQVNRGWRTISPPSCRQ